MSDRQKELFVFDILLAILKIEAVIKNFEDGDSLKYDFMAWDSVIREFEIIGEATKYLINFGYFDESKRKIVNFRNIIAHKYFGIDEEAVYNTAKKHLPSLKNEIKSVINEIPRIIKNRLIEELLQEHAHLPFITKELQCLQD